MSTRKPMFPYLIHYNPNFVKLFLIAYVLTYILLIILDLMMSEMVITLIFPMLLFLFFIMIIGLNNYVLKRDVADITNTGYYLGSIPTHAIISLVEDIKGCQDEEQLQKFFAKIFPTGLDQLRLKDFKSLPSPGDLLYELLKSSKTHEIDRIIKYYANDFTPKQNSRRQE